MKRSSSISRVFFRRPKIKELVPDLKLLLAVLTVGSESHVGCWIPGGLSEESGLDSSALDGGLVDLERRGFVLRDMATAEIFLLDFFRDNTFKGPNRGNQAKTDFLAVRSTSLRAAILKAVAASPECGLAASFLEKQELTC